MQSCRTAFSFRNRVQDPQNVQPFRSGRCTSWSADFEFRTHPPMVDYVLAVRPLSIATGRLAREITRR